MITGPCRVCGVTTKAPTPAELLCGRACEYLKARLEKYAAAGVKPGHIEYHPTTPIQRSQHETALRKRGLL